MMLCIYVCSYQVTFKTSAEPDEDSEEEPIQVAYNR